MMPHRPRSVLFVCLGNVCRSPLAEGILRHKVEEMGVSDRFMLDSCGTGAWHVGNPPDRRALATAAGHGVNMSDLRARTLDANDFYAFDYIFAMDRDNLRDLRARQPRDGTAELALYLDFCGIGTRLGNNDVPDPYYGGQDAFEDVFAMLDQASDILLQKLL